MSDGQHERRREMAARRRIGSIRDPRSAIRNPAAFGGFTLIEIMVVIAIILLLLGILLGAMGKFAQFSSTTAATQVLSSIQVAISAYKTDNNETLPPSTIPSGTVAAIATSGWQGGEILAQALSGAPSTDGKPGFGYVVGGRAYGPYMSTKHESNIVATTAPKYKYTLADSAGKKAVLYYAADPAGSFDKTIGAATAVWGTNAGSRFVIGHNSGLTPSENATTYWANGTLNQKDKATTKDRDAFAASLRTSNYLLVYPGPDDKYGTADDVTAVGR